jgi:hypothetical protein
LNVKKILAASVIANLVLVACLFCSLERHRPAMASIPRPVMTNIILQAQAVSSAPSPALQQSPSAPFQWSQLESSVDYRIYIKNLRSIGCPEQTLRDIVSGNVDRAFTVERTHLHLDGSEPGPWSELAEARFIDELLGDGGGGSGMEEASAQGSQGQDSAQSSPSFPLVLQKVDLDALGLNDDQKQVIAQLQQQFIDTIGGLYQDPNDPAYLDRWQKAQPQSDEMLKGLLGTTIFQNYQLAAAAAAQSSQP